ncbi:MAG: sigma-70 family RNA polymerase sigma factor, partial [Ignavibacteriaceae bacterium]
TELASILDMSADDVAYALQISGRHVSMDAPFSGDDDKNSLIDVLPNDEQPSPDGNLMTESLKNEVANILSGLTEKEAEVIRLYFGIGGERSATLEEIGERFNLTRERVRQIKEKAIRNLRHSPQSKRLKAYLG